MNESTCTVDDCTIPAKARGLCSTHYDYGRLSGAVPLLSRHRLTDIDFASRTGVCEVCGPVHITVKVKRDDTQVARCVEVWRAEQDRKAAREAARSARYRGQPAPPVAQRKAATPVMTKLPDRDTLRRATRASKLMTKYGLTLAKYDAMVAHQDGKCAICEAVPAAGLVVDHNHGNGETRGLLCGPCNMGIGHLGDSPARLLSAVLYLTAFTSERA